MPAIFVPSDLSRMIDCSCSAVTFNLRPFCEPPTRLPDEAVQHLKPRFERIRSTGIEPQCDVFPTARRQCHRPGLIKRRPRRRRTARWATTPVMAPSVYSSAPPSRHHRQSQRPDREVADRASWWNNRSSRRHPTKGVELRQSHRRPASLPPDVRERFGISREERGHRAIVGLRNVAQRVYADL